MACTGRMHRWSSLVLDEHIRTMLGVGHSWQNQPPSRVQFAGYPRLAAYRCDHTVPLNPVKCIMELMLENLQTLICSAETHHPVVLWCCGGWCAERG